MSNQPKEVHRTYQLDRYYRHRQEAIEFLGGKCVECGSTANLEFDHIDPGVKEYEVCDLYDRKNLWDTELSKCQLLCNDCHKSKTFGVPEHGTYRMHKHYGCRCETCVAAYRGHLREYMSEYRRKNGRPSQKKIK